MYGFFTFVLATLTVYRLSTAITREKGPFGLFLRLRGAVDPDQQTWLGEGLNCPFCVSFWLALPAALWLTVLNYADVWIWPLSWLGIAGAVALILRWEQKR